ncbi:terminal uridylyltransferase 4 [Salarias fasciatus]|uniref:terminal uridylyltransferase 4 n=1 Tax=Salarias fasciatus TaxID=181472 RepID=UPI001177001B|nr:terminal uridylyltransferase 4-like [Salarias fasciatus]
MPGGTHPENPRRARLARLARLAADASGGGGDGGGGDGRLAGDAAALAEQQLGLRQAEERLGRDHIQRLTERCAEFPSYLYVCTLCSVHVENVQLAHKHIKEKRHKKNLAEKQEEAELRSLAPPTGPQLSALDAVVAATARHHGVSRDDVAARRAAAHRLDDVISARLPGCRLRLYGSSATGLALKSSDVNVDVGGAPSMSQPEVLIQVLEILQSSPEFCDAASDFHAKVPAVRCRHASSGLLFTVSSGNSLACLSSDHLAALSAREPRLAPLVLAFRHWARLVHLDVPGEGGLPSYCLALMVLHFLQQREPPLLPVYLDDKVPGFHPKRADEFHLTGICSEAAVRWQRRTDNPRQEQEGSEGLAPLCWPRPVPAPLGLLWLELLAVLRPGAPLEDSVISVRLKEPLPREAKNWPRRRLAVEDPFSLKRNVARSLNSQMVFEYLQDRLRAAYRYFGHPSPPPPGAPPPPNQEVESRESSENQEVRKPGSTENQEVTLTESQEVEKPGSTENQEVTLTENQEVRKSGSSENQEVTLTENQEVRKPGSSENQEVTLTENQEVRKSGSENQEVRKSGSLENQEVTLTEKQEVRKSGSSKNQEVRKAGLSTNQEVTLTDNQEMKSAESLENHEVTLTENQEVINAESLQKQEVRKSGSLENQEVTLTENQEVSQEASSKNQENPDWLTNQEVIQEVSCDKQEVLSENQEVKLFKSENEETRLPESRENQEVSSENQEVNQEVQYVFDKLILTGGKPPTVVCSVCKRDGHVRADCPDDFKRAELPPLPEPSEAFLRVLDGVCTACYLELCLSPLEQQRREQILSGLERFIRKEFDDKARLCLFGSSKNGFGFRDSDLDICMTLEGHRTAEKLNCKEIIEALAKVLKKHAGLRNILPITTAKVPIVKFEHRQSGLEGDISLYNTLAQHNTRMLATYAALDPRVQLLGYTMKVFAKRCDIGDASRGSLSSYAHILLVLYFLQQRRPPVIPVLQEIYDGEAAPRRPVDGWNAFFYDDLQRLRRPPLRGSNRESVGALWLGLLRFYTEEFDFKEEVVSVRSRRKISSFQKEWTNKSINIEDPFDLNHNLGAGVSRKMTNFIMKALINGRRLFGTPHFPPPGTEMDYFFDSRTLTDGELAPNDRCCRVCGKIGHYMKDCPRRRRMKKKDPERDEDLKEDCGERRCFQCGDSGHVRRDCPAKPRPPRR